MSTVDRNLKILVTAALCLVVTACQDTSMNDLRVFVDNAHKDTKPEIEPLPAIRPYQGFTYSASDQIDPFSTGNLQPSDAPGAATSGPKPDTNRRKEPLEQFSLSGIQMVGTLYKDEAKWVIVSAPDGTVHRITTGNYLGLDYGRITGIEDAQVEVTETVLGPSNVWEDRVVFLSLLE